MKHRYIQRVGTISAVAALMALAACSDSSAPTSLPSNSGSSGTTQPPSTPTSTPATIAISAGNNQSAYSGAAVSVDPAVIVKDAHGAPVAGVTVTFTIAMGGGNVANATAVTNAQGIATAGQWILGAGSGTNYLDATTNGLPTVRFVADAKAVVTPSSYNITIRYLATATPRQQQAVDAAVARWQSVITKDLSDIPMQAPVNACFQGQPAINERIDDIVIYVEFVNIDGNGNVLGEAGPCYVRSDSNLPVVGHLKLDATDLAFMEKQGTLDDVVMHEMGHILGIGTLWPDKNLLTGKGGTDPRFIGANAVNAYHAMGGKDADVAVENTGADGTKDGHWRESVFGNELMTGYISGPSNPMSALTIASLSDLGYGTNSGAASSYTLTRTSGGIVAQGYNIHGHEDIEGPKYKIDHHGKTTKIDLN